MDIHTAHTYEITDAILSVILQPSSWGKGHYSYLNLHGYLTRKKLTKRTLDYWKPLILLPKEPHMNI